MSDMSPEEALQAIRAMGLSQDDETILETLDRCQNNVEEALHLLLPESPNERGQELAEIEGYSDIPPPLPPRTYISEEFDRDVDMKDTENLPGSGMDSDRDSTTVSYSIEDENNLRDVVDEVEEIGRQRSRRGHLEEEEFRKVPGSDDERFEYDHQISDDRDDNLPPPYDDAVKGAETEEPSPMTQPAEAVKMTTPTHSEEMGKDVSLSSIEFPLTHYYELEGRVHTNQWSIPYKRDESLAICMVATIKMIREGPGLAEGDENCRKFLDKTLPSSFEKLVTHDAVFKWDQSIMDGILDMCRILMELVAERLKQRPVPVGLLEVLALVFDADANFHNKMKHRQTDMGRWRRLLGEKKVFAQMPSFHSHKDTKGWLVEIINVFAQHGGVEAMLAAAADDSITLQELNALYLPFSRCEDYLNPAYLKLDFPHTMAKAFQFVKDLTDENLKDKKVGCVSDLLKSLKTLALRCSLRELSNAIDSLRLNITIRMLKIPHFNAKMNALKEVVRLTEEPFQAASLGVRSPITADKITEWLVQEKVLSIALQGNLHQAQYCDKLRSIVEFLGNQLSMEELTTMWEMQVDKNPVQIENVHGLIAAAASRSSSSHLDHVFELIKKSWETSASDRYREKLLELIGKIGRDDRQGKTASKILELLWTLAHLPQLSREMVELALESHSTILVDSYHTKDAEKKSYIRKCVEDIQKMKWVVSAFRQLHRFAKGFMKSGMGHKDQISELQRQHELIRLSSVSLVKMHQKAVQLCQQNDEQLTGATLVDGRYTHLECMDVHLQFMAFLLQEGALYLPNKRAGEIWETLIANPNACPEDRTLAFKWFDNGMADLEHETQLFMFNTCVLKVDPAKLDTAGYHCLRNFFETINLHDRKLKKSSISYHSLLVDNQDLTGLDYIWRAALEVKDIKIADELINNLLQVSYLGLNTRLKKDIRGVHIRFIDECFERLEDLTNQNAGGSPARTTSGHITDPEVKLQAIERLLILAQRYISTVEETHHLPRKTPPHGACFHGHHMVLMVTVDQQKEGIKLDVHSNETLLSVRHKIARRLGVAIDELSVGVADRWLESMDNNKLVCQVEFSGPPTLIAKTHVATGYGRGVETAEGNAQRQALAEDLERNLPGVLLASRNIFFEKLEQLCALGRPQVTAQVRHLLLLAPTNPRILQAMEVFGPRPGGGASDDARSDSISPSTVLADLFSTSRTTSTQLLYNLEVLSCCLIPIDPSGKNDQPKEDDGSSVSFRRHFLEHGGLKAVLSVLQQDGLPSDMDLNIRQDCYGIALSLARFLLCNQALLPPLQHRSSFRQHSTSFSSGNYPAVGATTTISEEPISDLPPEGEKEVGITMTSTPEKPVLSSSLPEGEKRLSKALSMEEEAARLTIETMTVGDFRTTLAHLMRVGWAAAAGQLHLASIGDVTVSMDESSTSCSLGPSPSTSVMEEGEREGQLRAGLCMEQVDGAVSPKNAAIASESLEMLMTCVKLRSSLLHTFYSLPNMKDFILDIIRGSPSQDVRLALLSQLTELCREIQSAPHSFSESVPVKRLKTIGVDSPRQFFLSLLLQRPESLWETKLQENTSIRQWERCSEYFELLCSLLQETRLSEEQEEVDRLAVGEMVKKELKWLQEVQLPSSPCYGFQTLMAGHLRLCTVLFSFERADTGHDLCDQLLSSHLFPASRMILDSEQPQHPGIINTNPTCMEVPTRVAAYDLLVTLCSGSYENFSSVATQLISMHHKSDPQIAKEWEYQPPVIGRSGCGYVGLKNAGATCYMNSVLQQLYMSEPVRKVILSSTEPEEEDETILPELQGMFGHLMQSRLQYYSPESFWKKFKLWGQPVNVREQQDAFDFFCNLTDQVDEQLKKKSCQKIFEKTFGGSFLDQKLCRGCDHTYEREESFLSLSLPVKSKTLEESLKEFVKGDWLEGDNAYMCEKCGEKRDTLKRMCIKTLPPLLMVHLKRFDYDWEANRAIKYDDFFEFPWELDMEPYTNEGLARMESESGEEGNRRMYELVGIVVHSGQASAGHYYSFIKQKSTLRDPTCIPEEGMAEGGVSVGMFGDGGQWLRFNDVLVDEFNMTNQTLEAECFGGTYKPKPTETHGHAQGPQEVRTRYWNAYMLFYEEVNKSGTVPVGVAVEGPGAALAPLSPMPEVGDKLAQLQALVQKGEKRQLFVDSMPARIQHSVNEENLQFMRHRDVYCPEYFDFIRRLAQCNTGISLDPRHPEQAKFGTTSLELTSNFFFHTYFRARKTIRVNMEGWVQEVNQLLHLCREACTWFMEMLATPVGLMYLKPFLLECTNREVRRAFCEILSCAVQNYVNSGAPTGEGPVCLIVDTLLGLLDKEVVDNSKTCAEYFLFFKNYVGFPQGCLHLLKKDVFVQLVNFLLGPSPKNNGDFNQQREKLPRRWSSNQVREFGPLHTTISFLVRSTDFSIFESEADANDSIPLNPYMVPAKRSDLQSPSDGMHQALFTIDNSKRFIRECVLTLRESDPSASDAIASTFCYCCWNNQSFSACTIEDLQLQISDVPSNETRNYFKVLTDILFIQDSLQHKRISFAVTGGKYKPHVSIFQTVQVNSSSTQSDSKKTYQGIKFLVGLANRSPVAREFLLSHASEWQWTVTWLRRKMADHYSFSSTSSSNEAGPSRVFQRTVSAQDTLDEANALLEQLEARDSGHHQTGSSDHTPSGKQTQEGGGDDIESHPVGQIEG